jgi:hypothetical protein
MSDNKERLRLKIRFIAIADQLQAAIRDGNEFSKGYQQLVKLGRDLRRINKGRK